PDGYVEGYRSLVADSGPMRFTRHHSRPALLADAAHVPAVARLAWFNHGFMRVEDRDSELVLSDLRMGAEPDYFFSFVVARRDGYACESIPPRQLRPPRDRTGTREATGARVGNAPPPDPAQAAAGNSGATPAASASK